MTRCRLCECNDRDALADEIARELWEASRDPEMDGPWETTYPFWRHQYTMFGRTVVATLVRNHG